MIILHHVCINSILHIFISIHEHATAKHVRLTLTHTAGEALTLSGTFVSGWCHLLAVLTLLLVHVTPSKTNMSEFECTVPDLGHLVHRHGDAIDRQRGQL